MNKLPEYVAMKQALATTDAIASASEAHGLLTGLFCSGKLTNMTSKDWARSSIKDSPSDPVLVQKLESLFDITYQQLDDMDFAFQLLLPPDDAPLTERVQELSAWCQGFMRGLEIGQVDLNQGYSDDCEDILMRFADIGQLDYEAATLSDNDEADYMNVVEYTRLAVLMVYTEIAKNNSLPDTTTVIH